MDATGVVVGKFDPPHRGHSLVIDVARSQVDRLTVLVWEYAEQTIDVRTRARWLSGIHPDVTIRVVTDVPEAVDARSWGTHVAGFLDEPANVFFSSEPYGEEFARQLGARAFNIDRDRVWVPCTSTMIRRAPLENLEWLAPVVRAHYVKRVCVVGSESTGKTTLCQRLATHFQTNWVPEYGREYSLAKQRRGLLGKWRSDEFSHIAREQQRWEDEAARCANRVLMCDTDAVATRIWHERYLGMEPPTWPLPPSRIDCYLVPYPDVPFVPDEIRDGEHTRFWMYERFIAEFERTSRPYRVLRGPWDERFDEAVACIDSLLVQGAQAR